MMLVFLQFLVWPVIWQWIPHHCLPLMIVWNLIFASNMLQLYCRPLLGCSQGVFILLSSMSIHILTSTWVRNSRRLMCTWPRKCSGIKYFHAFPWEANAPMPCSDMSQIWVISGFWDAIKFMLIPEWALSKKNKESSKSFSPQVFIFNLWLIFSFLVERVDSESYLENCVIH